MAAVQNAAAAVGLCTPGGVVVCVEKQATSKLLAPPRRGASDKVHAVDAHVFAATAGLASDASILVGYARLCAQRYAYQYGEPQPVEALVQLLCDYKHSYTQYGGLRPFGVAFLYAGWDRHHGFQLYQSDPSGNYSGWKATAIGSNSTSAVATLRQDFSETLSLPEAAKLALRVLTKAMDTTAPSAEKVEVVLLTREGGACVQRAMAATEVDAMLAAIKSEGASAGDA